MARSKEDVMKIIDSMNIILEQRLDEMTLKNVDNYKDLFDINIPETHPIILLLDQEEFDSLYNTSYFNNMAQIWRLGSRANINFIVESSDKAELTEELRNNLKARISTRS